MKIKILILVSIIFFFILLQGDAGVTSCFVELVTNGHYRVSYYGVAPNGAPKVTDLTNAVDRAKFDAIRGDPHLNYSYSNSWHRCAIYFNGNGTVNRVDLQQPSLHNWEPKLQGYCEQNAACTNNLNQLKLHLESLP